jgi:hypothetical protein
MGKLIELAERCEKAGAEEQRALLDEAWDALGPAVNWTAAQARRFGMMMDADAYESAAMLLVPEGWDYLICRVDGEIQCEIGPSNSFKNVGLVNAATPALAICASSLRARDGGEGL